jgi:hypothetical protein
MRLKSCTYSCTMHTSIGVLFICNFASCSTGGFTCGSVAGGMSAGELAVSAAGASLLGGSSLVCGAGSAGSAC